MKTKELMEHIYKLEDEKSVLPIFNWIDDLLCGGFFSEVDRILVDLDVDLLSSTKLVAFVSITYAAKDKLPNRHFFMKKVETQLEKIAPGRVERLLQNRW